MLLSSAERPQHALGWLRRIGVRFVALDGLVRTGKDRRQPGKGREIPGLDRRIDDSLDAVIARNECRIDLPHRLGARSRLLGLARKTRPPPERPLVVIPGICE